MKNIYLVFPEKLGTVAPEIYGHFAEHIGGVFYGGLWVGKDSKIPNVSGFRADIIEKLKKISAPVIRWPGGCFAEAYSWRDGIGQNRPVRPNWWTYSDKRYESNEVGTHEFFELCRLTGAKSYLAVNVAATTPMDIRNWLDYCTSPAGSTTLAIEREKNGHREPFVIDYIGIGNENWGDGGYMSPSHYADIYRNYAAMIYNLTKNNKTELVCCGANNADYNWTQGIAENFATGITPPLDGSSLHYYIGSTGGCTDFPEEKYYESIGKAYRTEELIKRHFAIAEGRGIGNKMKLVIDEWGCWHPNNSGPTKGYNLFEQQSTIRDALISAITLNIFNNNCDKVKMANVAQVCNNLHCLFLAGDDYCITTPTYHVFDIFKGHQGGQAIRTLTDCENDVKNGLSVSASVKDGVLTVTIANASIDEDKEISLNAFGAVLSDKAKAVVLRSDDVHDHNTPEAPDKVVPYETELDPRKSITVPAVSVMALEMNVD